MYVAGRKGMMMRKLKTITTDGKGVFGLCNDGSFWYFIDGEWIKKPLPKSTVKQSEKIRVIKKIMPEVLCNFCKKERVTNRTHGLDSNQESKESILHCKNNSCSLSAKMHVSRYESIKFVRNESFDYLEFLEQNAGKFYQRKVGV
jgi:hypothetical protein